MKYEVIHAGELGGDLVTRWAEIQEGSSELASPYFCPQFTQAVAAVRDDVYVGVMYNGSEAVGFFPFHRRGGVARPVGLGLSDYHGAIVEEDADWSAEDLLRGCGLVRYEFDHLIASQSPFAKWHSNRAGSPIICTADGYAAYESSRDRKGRKQLRETERKQARLEAEIGPLRFVERSAAGESLQTLFSWKSAHCRRTGTFDYFSLNWTRRLIERLHQMQGDGISGRLACLFAGDELCAVHFLMCSKRVWHSWFPAYDEQFRSYSPGHILLLHLIRAAADAGIGWIDLGKGTSTYKAQVMTGAIEVAEGSAEVPSLLNTARRVTERCKAWSQACSVPPLRIPARLLGRMERRARYV